MTSNLSALTNKYFSYTQKVYKDTLVNEILSEVEKSYPCAETMTSISHDDCVDFFYSAGYSDSKCSNFCNHVAETSYKILLTKIQRIWREEQDIGIPMPNDNGHNSDDVWLATREVLAKNVVVIDSNKKGLILKLLHP